MTKINILLACGAAFLCGCNKQTQNDSAKIEVLSQKLDTVISNQLAVLSELEAVKAQVTNLPSWEAVNNLDYYYYTNSASKTQMEKVESRLDLMNQLSDLDSHIDRNVFTNLLNDSNDIENDIFDLHDSIAKIDAYTFGTLFYLTNSPPVSVSGINQIEMESDVEQTKDDIGDIQEDLRKIKLKLGILY